MDERPPLWTNRHQAGLALADAFADRQGLDHHTTLLALPRGGVPVAAAMASRLGLPLATWSVRKIADPACPELAAALLSLRKLEPASLDLAVPVVDRVVAAELSPLVDRLVALAVVDDLQAVGLWYEHFEQPPRRACRRAGASSVGRTAGLPR
jgi:predicted phosphoribosyltransferase